ncbi:glycine betaine transporter [Geomicrobium halophilum]|uniref:Glycine betaine transporter n=1 Tax=Geomicrobium halophilum TaxID=549000 RepID=A0A841PSA2_9BACL|nr:BCCT family transporter [Geomicrobium halophilum]MBB6449171.1 glycine betaine transporter [Geomicrobium halophilum]
MAKHYTYQTKRPNIVFGISAILVLLFVLWGAINPESLEAAANTALNFTIENFGWFYMLATAFFVAFSVFLVFSPFGRIRLGKSDDRPEYPFYTWIGMIFAAGIGVGFVFWGVAEPVLYYLDPPEGITPETAEAAEAGLRYGSFHWSLHVWAIFGVVGLTLAYVQFRKDKPALISSAFASYFGKQMEKWPGKTIDTFAVLSTAMGVATTFGLSALQMSGGLSYISDIPNNFATQFTIIAVITGLFMISAATGVNRGIKYLSNVNLAVAGVLLLFVIIAGPTLLIAENFLTTLGSYASNIVPMSLELAPYSESESDWLGSNTIFFWAWHMSWAPFIGLFIARISRGRTVREYMMGVLIIPSLVGVIWFTSFGSTGLFQEMELGTGISELVTANAEVALFEMLSNMPMALVMSALAFILIGIFFITSADSASYVLGVMTSQGGLKPMFSVKLIWGVLIAGTASVLLLSEGLEGLQTAAIVSALPFGVIMISMVIVVLLMMIKDLKTQRNLEREERDEALKEDIREEMYDEMKDEVYDKVKEDVHKQVQEEMKEEERGNHEQNEDKGRS